MIQSVTVTNHLGESVAMELRSPEKSGFFIRAIDGLGPTKSYINTSEILTYSGSFFNSSRNVSRNIVFDLGFMDYDAMSIETIRQLSYRYFPQNRLITLEFETDNRSVYTTGYVESNEPDIFSKTQSASISVLCPSAYFYGRNLNQTVFSGSVSSFEFPFENQSLTESLIQFGDVYIDTTRSVVYAGDEPTGVKIYASILGNVNNFTMYNATLGQLMGFNSSKILAMTGSDLKFGDTIVISTDKGEKYVYLIRNGLAINILNVLDSDYSWFTVERGDNVFTFTADSGLDRIQVLIENKVIYGGI